MRIIEWTVWITMIVVAIGWIMNVVKLVGILGGDITAMFIARIAGVIIVPFGAVLGFM